MMCTDDGMAKLGSRYDRSCLNLAPLTTAAGRKSLATMNAINSVIFLARDSGHLLRVKKVSMLVCSLPSETLVLPLPLCLYLSL